MSGRFLFRDRRDSGRILAGRLGEMAIERPVVIGLPRGGVPVAYEVARALDAPLDIGLVRKLGAPKQPELGIGALGEDGTVILDRDTIGALGIGRDQIAAIVERERAEIERQRQLYRGDLAPAEVTGMTAIVVDDGLATGVTAVAAAAVMRARGAADVIVAVPVCPSGTQERLGDAIGSLVCLEQPRRFGGVGAWYADFSQTSDQEVVALLRAARDERSEQTPIAAGELLIPAADGVRLSATLRGPSEPSGLVIFVHGSGSSRLSPRNVAVARRLEQRGFATLLFDLLTPVEARDRRNVFDVELLTRRLLDATAWARSHAGADGMPFAYFGASTGAAAALRAAATSGNAIGAVVSRGGRPDLAGEALGQVTAPTLLVVGGADRQVLELNEQAARLLPGACELAVVPGAGHLFEEPGALEQVTRLTGDWLGRHLRRSPGADTPPTG
ncbi:MAG TPA: phosphoribosyltransferase family protein [Thermoleophilaceae bacterium]|nr:phosphoribosyltransferase family protein [Thermoleophilaceae bacterium]